MSQEKEETATFEYESSSPILNNRIRWNKRPCSSVHHTIDLPQIYCNVMAHLKGKHLIDKNILRDYLKMLNNMSLLLLDCKSQWFVKKIRGILQFALKSRKSFNDSLCEGEVQVMETTSPNSDMGELQLVYQELSQCLKQKRGFIHRRKLNNYLEKYSHYNENEGEVREMLLKIRGILKYLLLTREDFVAHLTTGDIILYDASEKLSDVSLTFENTENKESNKMKNCELTVDLPLDMLSNNNFSSNKDAETSEYYSRDMFSDTESLCQNSSEILPRTSQSKSEVFKTPLAPSVKPIKGHLFPLVGPTGEHLMDESEREMKIDYTQVSNKFSSKTNVESGDMFSETESLHQESQTNFQIWKGLASPQSKIYKNTETAIDIHENFEEAYNEYYKLASDFKISNGEVVLDNAASALLNTQTLKSDSEFFEDRQPFKNKFEQQITLKEAAKRIRESYNNHLQFVKSDFLVTLERLAISEGIKNPKLNTSDVIMTNDSDFDPDCVENLNIVEKIGEKVKQRLIERNVIDSFGNFLFNCHKVPPADQ